MVAAALALAAAACSGAAPAPTEPPPAPATSTTTSTVAVPVTEAPPTPTTRPVPTTTTTTAPARPIALAAPDPVAGPAAGQRFANPGAVVADGGGYVMFRNSFTSFPGRSVTHLLTSSDGASWEERGGGPVFTSDDVPFGGGTAFLTSAYVAADGTWVGYFYTWGGRFGTNVIGRATAPDPAGPWLPDPEPVLVPGPRRAWDGSSVIEPSVVATDDGFLMYYAGIDATGIGAIGLATSADGITWAKHDDPATGDVRFADSDPVLTAGGGWDGGSVGCPNVVANADGFLMTYDSSSPSGSGIGAAFSRDGVRWTPAPTNPQVGGPGVPGGRLFQIELAAGPGGTWLFLEVGDGTGTAIYRYRVDATQLR